MTTRLICPSSLARQTVTVNGHSYAIGDPSAFIDAPDADVAGLVSAGCVKVALVDVRKFRPDPAAAGAGVVFIDLGSQASGAVPDGTMQAPNVVVSDGLRWREVLTGRPALPPVA